jgi:predicted DNA-binding WGR domain protein
MEKKWCLLKQSDGARGDAGKKKVYEVRVADSTVFCEWGMAEKVSRQSSRHAFGSSQAALRFAQEKVWSKLDRGYTVAYTV